MDHANATKHLNVPNPEQIPNLEGSYLNPKTSLVPKPKVDGFVAGGPRERDQAPRRQGGRALHPPVSSHPQIFAAKHLLPNRGLACEVPLYTLYLCKVPLYTLSSL